jgi:hypothetical protein
MWLRCKNARLFKRSPRAVDVGVPLATYCAPVQGEMLCCHPIHDPQEVPHDDIQHCPHVGHRLSLRIRTR